MAQTASDLILDRLDRLGRGHDLRASTIGRDMLDERGLEASPYGLLIPRTLEEVVATDEVCREHGAPVVGRGTGTSDEERLLEQLGLDVEVLQSCCCGTAGSFDYEAGEKYEVSMRRAEDVLLPRVRASGNAYLLTDGSGCRPQIEHGAGRRLLGGDVALGRLRA